MKTTKKLFVLCLVLVLALASVMPSFAWFNHNGNNSGYGIYYKREGLPVSQNANVTITQTQSYTMENNKIKLTSEKNKIVDSTTATSVDPDHIQFYKTTIQNSGSADAYVNLYADGLTNSVNVLIGTNFPTINEQIVGKSERHLKTNPIRVYFEPGEAKTWKDQANIQLWAKVDGTYERQQMTKATKTVEGTTSIVYFTDSDNHWTNPVYANSSSYKQTYWADLPEGATEFYFSTESTAANATGFKRTRTFTSFVPQTVYSLTGYTTNDANLNAACTTRTESGAMSVPYVLDRVFTAIGGSVYVNLPGGNKGCSATYALNTAADGTGANPILTLNANTGLLTLNRSTPNGGVKTSIKGSALGDTLEVVTAVEREPNKSNIPICTNILVPKKVGDKYGEVYVEWYISNELQSSVNVPVNNLYLKY